MVTESQEATIAFLARPATYGRPGPVERIDTHAAIVFLVGDRAYKLKRAVTYPYLDYGTADLRRRACEAELVLNRRTAPELYLGMQAVGRLPDGRLTLEDQGEAVDWLVVMRRFDGAGLFDELASQGSLTPDLLRALADVVAAFHATAEVRIDHGGARSMRAVIDDNRQSMIDFGSVLSAALVEELHAGSGDALERVALLLDRRRQQGHVRRCHGDLHLRNIVRSAGRPLLFDCIEFSDELACIDVLYDLAFLLMDLWHRGLAAGANLVFNRYLDRADEADGLAAMPLMLSMRAAIRALVAAQTAARVDEGPARRREEDAARAYLEQATAHLRPSPQGLVAVGGLSGTGKSSLAYALAPGLGTAPGARVLRSDVVRKRLAGVPPETRLPRDSYSAAAHADTYAVLERQVAAALAGGYAAVADAVFARPDERNRMAEVAKRAGVPFAGFWLEAPADVLEMRLARRIADASDATADVLRRQLSYDIGSLAGWTRLDAGGELAATLAAARAALARR